MTKREHGSSLLFPFPNLRDSDVRWMDTLGYMVDIFAWLLLYLLDCLFYSAIFLWNSLPLFLSLWFKQNSSKSLVPWVAHNWARPIRELHPSSTVIGSDMNSLNLLGVWAQFLLRGAACMSLILHGLQWNLGTPGFQVLKAILLSHKIRSKSEFRDGKTQSSDGIGSPNSPFLKIPLPLAFLVTPTN